MQKNILITGSTDGIGKLAAIKLAKEGHAIFVHGRNEEKLATTISEIKEETQNENISGFVSDFSDLDAVKQMAQKIKNEVTHIDILINNAGVFKSPAHHNNSGPDIRFVVNYLAQVVLTRQLMPLIEKGTEARIINLSSAAQAPVSLEALKGEKKVPVNEAYAQSKLALTMWSFYLAKKLENISIVAVNPGSLLNTKMVHEAFGKHWSSASKGANILSELATAEEHKGFTGKYFDNDSGFYADAHPDAYNIDLINKLIAATNEIIE